MRVRAAPEINSPDFSVAGLGAIGADRVRVQQRDEVQNVR